MIALDAMGGDLAPAATVEGALRAHRERGLEIRLVGDELRLRMELRRLGAAEREVRIHHASEVVEMAEHPGQALRRKRDSSLRVCFDLCKSGEAAAMVSAGNSGAVLAGGLFVLGRLDHVERPASAAPCRRSPARAGPAARHGRQRRVHAVAPRPVRRDGRGLRAPRPGRRPPEGRRGGNGEEEGKGTALTRAAAEALRRPESGLEFKGYVEGKDVFSGEFDVVVTDGFTGNVVLKTAEGAAGRSASCSSARSSRAGWRPQARCC